MRTSIVYEAIDVRMSDAMTTSIIVLWHWDFATGIAFCETVRATFR